MATLYRALLVILVVLATHTPVWADFDASRRWFEQLPREQREDIQGYLILLARYGGLVDAEFGVNTYSAITSWQEGIGAQPTGILLPGQSKLLAETAGEMMSTLGMELVEDPRGRLTVMLPMALLERQRPMSSGTVYEDAAGEISAETSWFSSSIATLESLYRRSSAPAPGRQVTYKTIRDDLYVVTGTDRGRFFYELALRAQDGTTSFRFVYSEEYRLVGGIASVFAASYSAPLPVARLAEAPPTTPAPADPVSPAPTPKLLPHQNTSGADDIEHVSHGDFLTFPDHPEVILLLNDIGIETPLHFRRALEAAPDASLLILASNGGFVASALILAHEVHELGMDTYILPDTGCYSACAFIYFAGRNRQADGELGVHQMWAEDADPSSVQDTLASILDALNEFGVHEHVTSVMLRTPPEEMYVFSQAEIDELGINAGAEMFSDSMASAPEPTSPPPDRTKDKSKSSNEALSLAPGFQPGIEEPSYFAPLN